MATFRASSTVESEEKATQLASPTALPREYAIFVVEKIPHPFLINKSLLSLEQINQKSNTIESPIRLSNGPSFFRHSLTSIVKQIMQNKICKGQTTKMPLLGLEEGVSLVLDKLQDVEQKSGETIYCFTFSSSGQEQIAEKKKSLHHLPMLQVS